MATILGVGIATLDIINTVDHYPQEDEEMRALSQRIARGGNCTNTLVALSQLGHTCHWAGVLADEPDGSRILDDLDTNRVAYHDCMIHPGGKVPTSYINLNQATGTRTIVHYRDLPELPYKAFEAIELDRYDWVHFEGRNVEQTAQMMQRVAREAPVARISLEIEKPREGIEALFDLAHVVIFSRAFALSRGYEDGAEFLKAMHRLTRAEVLYCAWGELGGYGMLADGSHFDSPAFPPEALVDTIAAGDVFNAGVINASLNGHSCQESLQQACRVAGDHCGVEGIQLWNFNLPYSDEPAH
ncbi:MAG: ketohexokinase [Gammaproteobacteria bacterium]|nr:ketohexokinase [Gammaproteobacteria bacterium]